MNKGIKGAGSFLLMIMLGILSGCSGAEEQKTVPATHKVEIVSMQFQPAELSVQKGDTVVFINQDIVVHDVTEEKSKAWTSSALSTGQSYNLVVTEDVDYYCSIHPVMKGKLLVK